MIKYKNVICQTPKCPNKVSIRADSAAVDTYCPSCKKSFPRAILRLQSTYDSMMPQLLIDVAKIFNFKSGEVVAGAMGIPRKKFMGWLQQYLKINTWSEFKKTYYCRSSNCFVVDVDPLLSFGYIDRYYFVRRLKLNLGICSCLYKLKDHKQISQRVRLNKNLGAEKVLIKIPHSSSLERIQKLIISNKLKGTFND